MSQTDKTDGRSRRAEAQRERRRLQILQSALTVFSRQGYHNTSITDIVETAGVARGTFYQYFDSKKTIFLELLRSLLHELGASIVGVDERPDAPPIPLQLVGTLQRILEVVVANRDLTIIVFQEAVGLDKDVDHLLKTFNTGLHGYIQTAISRGQERGLVRSLDSEVASCCIVGSMRQVAFHFLVENPHAPFHIHRVAQEIVSLHLNGMLELSLQASALPPDPSMN